MKEYTLNDKYPISAIEIKKSETSFKNIAEIFEYFKTKIEENPIATYIATFDHYKHTKSLAEHKIQDGLLDAQNLIFCFGKELPHSKMLAVRPRSIGVGEYEDYFEVSIMDAPNPAMHEILVSWIKSLKNK